jgi:hypothetical protein
MRRIVLPAVVAALLAASPFAFAAETATGAIKAFNMKTHTQTLEDGTMYYLPKGFKDPGFKAGQKVTVVWSMMNGKHEASSVTMQK